MKMTTEEAFIKVLQMHGIEHAFGIIGSAMMPISDLFPAAGIKFWDCAHETSAGMIADGYTLLTWNGVGFDFDILAEESAGNAAELRDHRRLWCVDPMDGTKEFINHTDEFAAMIGLVEDGRPVLGVVNQAATGTVYRGIVGDGAEAELLAAQAQKLEAEAEKFTVSAESRFSASSKEERVRVYRGRVIGGKKKKDEGTDKPKKRVRIFRGRIIDD